MRRHLLFAINLGAAFLLTPIGYGYNCPWTSAKGDSSWTLTAAGNGPPAWVIMERKCKTCDSLETRTECVAAGEHSPTWYIWNYNPITGKYDIDCDHGGFCMQKDTVDCD
jgi:hypothetical protein